MNEDLSSRLNELKGSIQTLWDKISENDFEMARKKISTVTDKVHEKVDVYRQRANSETQSISDELDSEHNYAEDLPLTLHRDVDPDEEDVSGVKYYSTENSPLSVGAEKVEAGGIDSFGEDDTFDPEEASEHQSFRDRNQNSDLTQRYYSPGLDLDK